MINFPQKVILIVYCTYIDYSEAVRHERDISNAGRKTLDFAEIDQCKPVLLGLSLAGNLVKPFLSLYGTEWRERGYGLSTHSSACLVCKKCLYEEKFFFGKAEFKADF